jgi:tRNA/tmRNA/rRNA uracil-C5-methylase (TrmA/RlmC/RlmD family)
VGEISVTIEKIGGEGRGIARVNGKIVMIRGVLPGETVQATVTSTRKDFLVAKLDSVNFPSPRRTTPPCPLYMKCGGCSLQHAEYPFQMEIKKDILMEMCRRIGRFTIEEPVVVPSPSPWGYRNSAEIAVALRDNRLIAGFHQERTHRVLEMKECLLMPDTVNTLFRKTIGCFNDSLDAFRGCYLLNYKTSPDCEQNICALDYRHHLPEGEELTRFYTHLTPHLSGLIVTFRRKIHRAIGDESVLHQVAGNRFRNHVDSFFQVNREKPGGWFSFISYMPGGTGKQVKSGVPLAHAPM